MSHSDAQNSLFARMAIFGGVAQGLVFLVTGWEWMSYLASTSMLIGAAAYLMLWFRKDVSGS